MPPHHVTGMRRFDISGQRKMKMRKRPHIQKLFIDPNSQSPLYEGSAALKDVRAGARLVTVGVANGSLTLHEFASDWYVQTELLVSRFDYSSVVTALVADTARETVYLADLGIHHHSDDEPRYFSVVVAEDSITELWLWLKMVKGWSEAANTLREMFPDYFTPEKMPDISISISAP